MASEHTERKDEIVTVRLDGDTVDRLRNLAREHERTVSAELRLAVRFYLADYRSES